MALNLSKIEFDLTIKKYGPEEEENPYDRMGRPKENKLEIKEELHFKSLNATEVMRKILDYIRTI